MKCKQQRKLSVIFVHPYFWEEGWKSPPKLKLHLHTPQLHSLNGYLSSLSILIFLSSVWQVEDSPILVRRVVEGGAISNDSKKSGLIIVFHCSTEAFYYDCQRWAKSLTAQSFNTESIIQFCFQSQLSYRSDLNCDSSIDRFFFVLSCD